MKIIRVLVGILFIGSLGISLVKADDCESVRQQNDALRKELKDDAAIVGDLRQQLTVATNTLALSSETNSELQARLDQVTGQRDEAVSVAKQLAPAAAKAVKLPLTVSWRNSLTGRGRVLQLHGTTTVDLPVIIECNNATFGSRTFNAVVPGVGKSGLQFSELGVREGWDFISGDTVKITSAGYELGTVTCP